MKKRVLVLGATGQIGNLLFKQLSKVSDFAVTGTSRTGQSGFLKFDPFRDEWTSLGKADVLINCIGIIQEKKEHTFKKIHVDLTKKVLANRLIIGNPRIIQISALGADAFHEVDFLRTKGEADDYLIRFDNVAVVRPSIICTHRTMLVRKILLLKVMAKFTGGLLFLPAGFAERKIQPIMPEDLAAIVANLICEDSVSKIISIAGPDPLSFRDIIYFMPEGKRRIIEIPKFLTDLLVRYFINPLFPGVINEQQYRLLFADNVADPSDAQVHLSIPLRSTIPFWKQELK